MLEFIAQDQSRSRYVVILLYQMCRIKVEEAKKQKRSKSEIKYENKIFRSEIFLYVQITEPGRFLLGRETKFELNSLAPGFSFDFHQIKLQEEKLLLKTREVKEP